MNARKSLAAVALTGMLFGMTACGSNDTQPAPASSGPAATGVKTDTQAAVTDLADTEAKEALQSLCAQLPLTEVATLLEVPTVELRDGVAKAQDSLSKDKAYCSFMEPGADEYGTSAWDAPQVFLSITVTGPANTPCEQCTGGTVEFGDGSTGYYAGTDNTGLFVTPKGSAYEFAINAVLPYEVSTASGLDRETADLFRMKAAEAAHMALG